MIARRVRTFAKWLVWTLGIVGLVLAAGALALTLLGMPTYEFPAVTLQVNRSPARVEQGRRLTRMLCMRCHYDTNDRSLEGIKLTRVPWRIGTMHSANITRDEDHGIGRWSDGEIALALRTGVHPPTQTLMVPIMPRWPRLATEDLESIIALLRSDDPLVAPSDRARPPLKTTLWTKYFAYAQWEPFGYPRQEIPRPSADDPVVYGEYLVNAVLQCNRCHDAAPPTMDTIDPRTSSSYLGGGADLAGIAVTTVTSANLTPHSTGLSAWTASDLRRALIDGFRPDGTVLRWPMQRYGDLSVRDVEAIYAYLRTVPALDHAVVRAEPRQVGAKADPGLHVFQKYGCVHCHGTQGEGLVDMAGVDEAFATDDALVAFIKDPSTVLGPTVMPAWDGVVAPEDYPALCEITRRLARTRALRQQADAKSTPP